MGKSGSNGGTIVKVFIEESYDALSRRAADIIFAVTTQDRRLNVALTAGNTPKGAYEIVIKRIRSAPEEFNNLHYYTFDEIPIAGKLKGHTINALDRLFFQPAGIAANRIHPLTYEAYSTYDEEIANAGGLDLMLIGLGADGHFCGNMPYVTKFEEQAYRAPITKEYDWYGLVVELCGNIPIPEYFVTLGAVSIMKVRHLVMIVNGVNKAEAVKRFFESPVDTAFPASILKLHPNMTLIMDREAASGLKV
ncbi:glucosamine-6-phosphate deaminase [Treponema primitia]|uniref:glucosamine-6-phosphate deaminase n=1 Tax=Treponema primitia TaxID=88058 RepID=UPI00397F800E